MKSQEAKKWQEELTEELGIRVIADELDDSFYTVYYKLSYDPEVFKKIVNSPGSSELGGLHYIAGSGYFIDLCDRSIRVSFDRLKPELDNAGATIEHILVSNASVQKLQKQWDMNIA